MDVQTLMHTLTQIHSHPHITIRVTYPDLYYLDEGLHCAHDGLDRRHPHKSVRLRVCTAEVKEDGAKTEIGTYTADTITITHTKLHADRRSSTATTSRELDAPSTAGSWTSAWTTTPHATLSLTRWGKRFGPKAGGASRRLQRRVRRSETIMMGRGRGGLSAGGG